MQHFNYENLLIIHSQEGSLLLRNQFHANTLFWTSYLYPVLLNDLFKLRLCLCTVLLFRPNNITVLILIIFLVFFVTYLLQLLQSLRRSCLMEEMKVGEIFNKFYGELAVRSKISDTGRFQFSCLCLSFYLLLLFDYFPHKLGIVIPLASVFGNGSCHILELVKFIPVF